MGIILTEQGSGIGEREDKFTSAVPLIELMDPPTYGPIETTWTTCSNSVLLQCFNSTRLNKTSITMTAQNNVNPVPNHFAGQLYIMVIP